jgi:hypothetical protein
MADTSLTQTLVGWFIDLLEDAQDLLTGEDTRRAIIADLGGNPFSPSAAPQFPPAGLQSAKAYRDAAEPDLEALFAAIQDVRSCINTIRSFADSLDLGASAIADEVFRDLLDLLALNFVRLRAPRLYYWLQAASFAEDFSSVYGGQFGGFTGLLRALKGAFNFIIEPCAYFDRANFDDEESVRRISDRTLFAIAALTAYGFKVPFTDFAVPNDDVLYGWDLVPGVPGSDTPTAVDRALARTLTLKFTGTHKGPITGEQPLTGTALTSLAFLPRTQGGPGLFLSFGGGYEIDAEVSEPWYLSGQMQATGGVSCLIGADRGFEIAGPAVSTDFRGGLAFEARPNPLTKRAFDIRLAKGTGISVGLLRFEIMLTEPEATIKTIVRDGALTVGKIFDGFLDRLIPADGLRVAFDFAVGLSSLRGVFLEGQAPVVGAAGTPATAPAALAAPGAAVAPPRLPPLPRPESTGPGVSVRIPIGKSVGPLTIHDVQLRVGVDGPSEDRTYLVEAAASLSAKLGPVLARVDRIGARVGIRLPDDLSTANLGLIDLDIGPKLPDGIALAIDSKGVVTGGGFLFRDRAQELYAGVMQLTLHERITLKAFGLVATRMPDGSKGYSLIVFITAEDFRPIPIGMACTLQGIGGMVAINRTFSEDAMREGLKNNTLGTLLFPRDPIRNAPEIIRNLATIFPARAGSYMFGLLAKIGWFSPTLVTLELALIFEFGARRRLIVLGRVSSLLPSRDNALIRLNLDAFGLIDFDEGTASIDAFLVDSRLAHKFVLTGGMALRARWTSGTGAGFALAVGGLNPRFAPPTGMPTLDRVTIALSSGSNPRLTCAAYFAITSNTIQFGARAQLYAAAYGFSLEGDVGFDVLIQLAPFHFIADFHASIQLKRGSRNLFKVSVAGELEGPRPLRVAGKASFEIFWCDFTVRFDKTLIEGEKPPLPPAVDVLGELQRALTTAESWSTLAAANRQHGVTLRALKPGATLVLDPLGNLMVKQSVVPLNTARDIDTFGGAPIAGARRFQVTATLNGQSQQVASVKDQFVPAQFFSMSDEEKLASPSFEDMEAGVVFGSDAVSFAESDIVAAPLAYESIVIDSAGRASRASDPYVLSAARLVEQAGFGAVAQASVRTVGLGRFRDAAAPRAVTMHAEQWTIASAADTTTTPEAPSAGTTWAEARAAVRLLNRRAAADDTAWQLVPVHETLPR